ncbi:MAG: hypothetical protein RLZZ337_1472, partial [Bacteroidota bacterium]
MNYIGSKVRLLPFLETSIREYIGGPLQDLKFCDLFAGTGAVGRFFKHKVKGVIANDLEYYSFVLSRNYVQNNSVLNYQTKLDKLNNTNG